MMLGFTFTNLAALAFTSMALSVDARQLVAEINPKPQVMPQEPGESMADAFQRSLEPLATKTDKVAEQKAVHQVEEVLQGALAHLEKAQSEAGLLAEVRRYYYY